MKRIVYTKPGVAEFEDFELGNPAAGQVQVELNVSTISSGTERANLMGDLNVSIYAPPAKEAVFPRLASGGYSSAGVVTAVGEGVEGLNVGDRVALSWSSHSQRVNIKAEQVYRLPENVSDKNGALVHISTFPLAAIRKCRLELGEPAVVMGLGVLGMAAVKLLKAAGAAPVVAVDPVASKREQAIAYGADYALNPFDADFAAQAKALTGGGAKVGIEVTGFGKGLDGILDAMAPFGRVALLGCTRSSDFSIDYYRKVHGPGITLIGAHTMARPKKESFEDWWTERDDALALIKLISLGRVDLAALVEETHSPEEAPEIYERLAKGGAFPVVQFDWRCLK